MNQNLSASLVVITSIITVASLYCLVSVVDCDLGPRVDTTTRHWTTPQEHHEANFNYNHHHHHHHHHHVDRKQLAATNDYVSQSAATNRQTNGVKDVPMELRGAESDAESAFTPPASLIGAKLTRIKREPVKGARPKLGKAGLLLARHPTAGRYPTTGTNRATTSSTSTTTTTSTTTSASTLSSSSESTIADKPLADEDDNASEDYEEIESTKTSKASAKVEQPEESAEGEQEETEEEEQATTSTTTTTTTTTTSTQKPTTKQPTTRVKGGKGAGMGAIKSRKGTKQQASSKQKQSEEPQAAESSGGLQAANNKEEEPSREKEITANNSTTGTFHHKKRKPLVSLPFIKAKNASVCAREAYLEFPADLIGNKWRGRGLVVVHIAVVCYMFYSLALVCERYFMPSLEEFAQRLNLSEDVAGATLMSAGSSAPELFTAILGVFVAKGDVGTGTVVGSAVFNILFVIGVCAFVSTTSAQLQWWPVLRDSVYYAFTVLVLILFIYDERITASESFIMIVLYGLYILIMANNDSLREMVTTFLMSYPLTAKLISSTQASTVNGIEGPDDVFGSTSSASGQRKFFSRGQDNRYQTTGFNKEKSSIEEDSVFMAAMLVIVQHKRLFRSNLRFQSAARYIIIKRQHRLEQQRQQQQQQQQQSTQETKTPVKCSDEVNYFGPESEPLKEHSSSNQRAKMEAYAKSSSLSKQKFSIVSKDDYEFWNRPPNEGENYYLWMAKIPVNYVLHYTIPDCSLYPDKYLITFLVSIMWTAFFSYTMVWMVTLIGYTFGIPDSVMGVTFLAAGTSVPDCYSSVHAARNGMADMAVSNSIGSNVFDILIGLSVPWFIQSAIYPGIVATINSRGVIYSVILLFLSLIVTIYLLNKYEWTLKPRLGLALLIAYGLFIVLTCMLEFNLFGHVNPPPCPVAG